MVTDGVFECRNRAGELFGQDRLEAAVTQAGQQPAATLAETIANQARGFADGQALEDDLTVLVAEWR
jgi:sigma-B regulation protein RsbU (phosphoserine phosphatase)